MIKIIFLIFFTLTFSFCYSQISVANIAIDSPGINNNKIPLQYLKDVNKKISKFSNRVNTKTEKTLSKLSRWESKIHKLLIKVDPATAQQLFGEGQVTFSEMLKRYREGTVLVESYTSKYDYYIDQLSTQINYLKEHKDELSTKQAAAFGKGGLDIASLEDEVNTSDFLKEFILKRKNQLIDKSFNQLGKTKALKKLNKEAYYYATSIKNYKEIFSDSKKTEELVMKALSEIPSFQKFAQNNNSLAGTFGMPVSFAGLQNITSVPIINGIATRVSLQQYIQTNVPVINLLNAQQIITSRVPDLNMDLINLDFKAVKEMGNAHFPEFEPSAEKLKTFFQRLEYGVDMQFGKSLNYLPTNTNFAVKIGYKINEKRSVGIGINYILGMGEGWRKIKFTNEGLGLRSYVKWKILKGLDLQGGAEWNYMLKFNKIEELKQYSSWKKSALIGISKNFVASKKVTGNFQILFDFLYSYQVPVTQPFVFRYGYNF